MISHSEYVAGWYDSSVADFLGALPRTFDSVKYSLITCLDSNREPATLLNSSPALRSIRSDVRTVGSGFLLPTELLIEGAMVNEIFFGFDEVWLFPNEITQPRPTGMTLVGPAKPDQVKLDAMSLWLSDNSCSLALGDGDGLNFVVKAQGLVRYVLGHSLEQSRPNVIVEAQV